MTQTTPKEYTLDFIPNGNFSGDAPDAVNVTISKDDVINWLKLADFIKSEHLLCAERFDARCRFVYDDKEVDCPIEHDIDFNPDFQRLEVQSDEVSFVGELKHGGCEESWMTRAIPLSELREAFAIDV